METLTLASLNPSAVYCVVTDPPMRESILAFGRAIQAEAETSRDFKRFGPTESTWPEYVMVNCGRFSLSVWRDPTRPELNAERRTAPVSAPAIDPDLQPEERPERAPPDERSLARAIARGAARVARTLYVQQP